jgi:signal transduction histidine kinase
MLAPPISADEDRPPESLYALELIAPHTEPRFDRITRLACFLAKVPIALICVVDAHRQRLISTQGLDGIALPDKSSFCLHALLQEEPLIVPDACADARFTEDPLVSGAPFGRFYAGFPVHSPGGSRVGTLCVVDTEPRLLSSQELAGLQDLAAWVATEMLAMRFNIATRAVGVGVHERHAGDRGMWWSDAMWDIFGQDARSFRPSADNWLAMVHPEDQEHVRANGGAWGNAHNSPSVQYRIIRPDGTIRHLHSIASTTHEQTGSCVAGITLDVTERVSAERREQGLQQKLRESSHQAGMAEVATVVLHSVGNVLNSLGIANETIRRDLNALRLEQLEQATALIQANRATLASYLTDDARGRHLPDYMPALSAEISSKVQAVQAELDTIDTLLEHLRNIVSAQKMRAQIGGHRELVNLQELLEAALAAQEFELSHILVLRDYEDLPLVTTDRHKVLLILVNLLENARDAVLASVTQPGRIAVHLGREGDHALISIEDSGIGMSADVLSRLWRFGFTTKPNGRGFDLHNSANAAREIGATISAHSDGPHQGARFVLRLPLPKADAARRGGN